MKQATLTILTNDSVYQVKRYNYRSKQALINRIKSITNKDYAIYSTIGINTTFQLTF